MQQQEHYAPIPEESDDDYEFLERVAIMQYDGGLTEQQAWDEAVAIYSSKKL
jgi:hypothetical protein